MTAIVGDWVREWRIGPLDDWAEGERDDVVAVGVDAKRNDREFEFHADSEISGLDLNDPTFDLDFVADRDVANIERYEVFSGRAAIGRRRRRKALCGPCPQCAAPRQRMFSHFHRCAPRARVLARKRDHGAIIATSAEQMGVVASSRKEALGHGRCRHSQIPILVSELYWIVAVLDFTGAQPALAVLPSSLYPSH